MAKIVGGRVNVAIAREATTRGVAEKTNMYWLPWTNLNFDDKVEKYVSREALGVIDDSSDMYTTEKWGEGTIDGEIRDKSFGLLLFAALGSWSAGANGAAFDHTFTVSQTNQHQSMSLWFDDPNGDYLFELAMLENLEVTLETGKLAMFSAGFVSRPSQSTSMVAGVNLVPAKSTLGTENKFVTTNASVFVGSDRSNLTVAPEISVQNLRITIAKNLRRKNILGSAAPDDIINQVVSVEGSITLPYQDKIYKDYFSSDTYKAMKVVLENRAVNLGGGVTPKIVITLPRVSFYDWTPERPKGELAEQTIGFRALRDMTNAEDLIYNIVLTNAVGTSGY